jgi:hypothetical protein
LCFWEILTNHTTAMKGAFAKQKFFSFLTKRTSYPLCSICEIPEVNTRKKII